jgi:predicted AlkP superfamily phosphohydrolase/phosphomutase
MKKVAILGLDCATPQLLFDAWRKDLPNLSALMEKGSFGKLRSTVPPITVPAWTAMMTSQDPGQLGFYGFRNREAYDYKSLYFANANYVNAKTLWNYMARDRRASLVFGVPQTYPPKPMNGMMVGCFLTPNKGVQYTWPDEVKAELDQVADGNYMIDVDDFRTDDKDRLLEQIYIMTDRRWKAFRHFFQKDDYGFAMVVEMGIDRIHHGFWRYFDQTHRLYEPGNKYENVIHDYYVHVDKQIGETVKLFDEDTLILVVSDHGAKGMVGAICVNEWMQQNGYLAFKEPIKGRTKFKMDLVDWSRTRAWGEGGYYSRIFFNVAGREPEGIIPASQYENFRYEMIAKLEAITDDKGVNIGTRAFRPQDIYKKTERIPPDLVVYFGNLDWRAAGVLGTGSIHMFENDTGPDDANHAQDGIIIANRKLTPDPKAPSPYSIYDVAPTVLTWCGIPVPEHMIGRSLL